MKKSYWLIGVLVAWLLSTLQVRADLIWEPYGNDFYMEHADACEYVNRIFTTNGPDGRVIIYVSPENPKEVLTLENGTNIHISFTYKDADGIVWGVYENLETKETGWMPMDYMTVVYDYISFREEFGTEIVDAGGTLSEECRGTTVYFYNYPGAENGIEFSIDANQEHLPSYSSTFVDEEGRTWGCFGYYYGLKNKWICLDNPSATFEELYPNGAPVRGESGTNTDGEAVVGEKDDSNMGASSDAVVQDDTVVKETELIKPKQDNGLVGVVTAIVAAVVAVTGGLLAWLKRKK